MFSKIVVPLDGSELAESVLKIVEPLTRDFESQIMLVRVVEPSPSLYFVDSPTALANILRRNKEDCLDYLNAVANRLWAKGLSVNVMACDGVVASTIVDVAEKAQADLIAMTTHGRSGVGRWLLGSVADRVVKGSRIPILLSRGLVTESAKGELIEDRKLPQSAGNPALGLSALIPFSTVH